jgi:hypothetical protein
MNNVSRRLLLLLLLVFVSGCLPFGDGDGIDIDYEKVYSGTDGIVADFLKNAPQDRLYSGTDFKIGLDIANIGAYTTDVNLRIGYERDYMEPERAAFTINNLEGKSAYNLEGNRVYEFIDAKTLALKKTSGAGSLVESHKALISVTYCYDYQTLAKADVCVDTDVYDEKLRKVCAVSDKSLSSQGAPVAVKKIEVEMLPVAENNIVPQFTIHLQNVGDGTVIKRGQWLNACMGEVEDIGWDTVEIEASLSNNVLDCKKGSVKLDESQGEIRCTGNTISQDRGTYAAPLVIKLYYGYYSIITKNVEILREEI